MIPSVCFRALRAVPSVVRGLDGYHLFVSLPRAFAVLPARATSAAKALSKDIRSLEFPPAMAVSS